MKVIINVYTYFTYLQYKIFYLKKKGFMQLKCFQLMVKPPLLFCNSTHKYARPVPHTCLPENECTHVDPGLSNIIHFELAYYHTFFRLKSTGKNNLYSQVCMDPLFTHNLIQSTINPFTHTL